MSVPCFHPSFGVSAKDKAKVGTFLSYLRFWNYILRENFQGRGRGCSFWSLFVVFTGHKNALRSASVGYFLNQYIFVIIKVRNVRFHFFLLIIKVRNVRLHFFLLIIKVRNVCLHFFFLIIKVRNVRLHFFLLIIKVRNVRLHFFLLIIKVRNVSVHTDFWGKKKGMNLCRNIPWIFKVG